MRPPPPRLRPRQAGAFATTASYHPSGRLVGFSYGNGVTRAVTLNARQLPQRLQDQRLGMPVLDHTLAYDAAGNLKSIADGVPGGLESRTLHYDGRDRLTAITASPQGPESYVYDPLDNIRQTTQGGTDRRFHYAAATQRLEWIRTPAGQNLLGYQWNDRGELTRRTQFTPGTPPATPPTLFRSGFESGLIESRTEFEFDRAHRLTGSHGGQVSYLYDAHGRRVRAQQQFFGSRYEVYSQGGQLLHLEDGPAATRHDYIQLGGRLIAEREHTAGGSASTHYLHSDLLGSPSVKTANQGSVVYRARYQAFGAPYDGWRDGPGYTQHVMDSASELIYMQQRYYDPATLRFISIDPVSADALNFNRYWYANNNPYAYTDPDGRDPERAYGAAVGFMLRNDPEKMQVWAGGEATATSMGSGAEAGAAIGQAVGAFVDAGDYSGTAVAGVAVKAAVMAVTKGKATVPYKRPSGATTPQQRASVQGKPCIDCGAVTPKQVADHKTPLVQEHYETGAIDKTQMKSVDAVQPQCPTCSARQGAEMSRYSREQRRQLDDQ